MTRLMPPPDWACAWIASLVGEEVRSFTRNDTNEVNAVFRLEFARASLFLKIGPNLEKEYNKLRWMEGRLSCPCPVGFLSHSSADALLTSAIEGEDLAALADVLPPETIIARLTTALQALHTTPITDWPFERSERGKVLVHGDACLPNFLYHGDHLSGYIDLGDLRVGSPEIDLAAAVWSLQYNLGPGHGLAFLRAYGWQEANEDQVERLRRKYEENDFEDD
ncbi:MAG TPA: phosphotransferase [Chthonomonadaceae bacterium]|nr:phosphotransferase [Chthonomonadaceae bacterium]